MSLDKAECSHCWHQTGVMLASMPPQSVDKCCDCGATRNLPVHIPFDSPDGHGPHHPAARFLRESDR